VTLDYTIGSLIFLNIIVGSSYIGLANFLSVLFKANLLALNVVIHF